MKPLFLSFLLIIVCSAHAQEFTINGTVRDDLSGESLIGATIFNPRSHQGATTNNYGLYSLTQTRDSVTLHISYVGYKPSSIKFLLTKDTTLNIGLSNGTLLQEIVIQETATDKIQESSRMGTIDVPIEQIKALPAFMGEVDVLKVLQLLPGVQAGSEGSSGLYVRGGGPDQNLILLDGVPVYNASHLFGFFSVFNADAINRVELVKGGFPARYGGRLSSVIDITMKEGDSKKIRAEGSIGLVASRLTVEGPVGKKNNTTFIVSGRRTYIDVLASPLIRLSTKGDERAGYYFYDFNAKINQRINEKNRVFLSLYAGNDKAHADSRYSDNFESQSYDSEDNLGLRWGNMTTALRWNSIINKKLFSNVSATYSRYKFEVSADSRETTTEGDSATTDFFKSKYVSGIRDFALKADLEYLPSPNHYIRFGAQVADHLFSPGVLNYRSTDVADSTFGSFEKKTHEFLLYLEDDFLITPSLKVNAGLHASGWLVDGKMYSSLQPRVSARYLLSPQFSLKASYAKMSQFIHLLSNAGIGLPTDLWVPATAKVGPENSYLTSVGAAYNLNNQYEFSVEGYYKNMKGLIEYKDGADYLNIENDWQTKVEIGKGNSYGLEFFLQKKTGKFSGWIGYTLSWTNRTFDNINEGKTFPYRYDRRHDIKIAAIYEVKKNNQFSLTWVYGTGAAVSLPQSHYQQIQPMLYPSAFDDASIDYYGGRNSFRMRAYHRLDLSFTTTKKMKWGERSWSFGVYNAYNRKNPFFIGRTDSGFGQMKFVQYSLFPIIPSISYRFKF
ncbi:MAG TPA: TonB-dependent receptor [Chryseolinea sp.]|nr:TonB-dependent receptor [Chryseolinea sp.]